MVERIILRAFSPNSSVIMKCLRNSVVSFVLMACCFSRVNTATTEEIGTIFLRLYTGSNIDDYVDAHLEEAETLIRDLNINKPTVLYIHGFTESVKSTSVHTVINAYLNRTDHNVLALDYSVIAGKHYREVAANVDPVATAVTTALNDMVQAGLPSENIHLVGHSMGAQVSAYVGRKVDFSLQRITGLDPAGPLFNFPGRHLTRSDARFVDIIHTDAGVYGFPRATGSTDFFPNGGRRIQPGCPHKFKPLSTEDFCSHHQSWVFYAESLIMEKAFLAIECSKRYGKRRSSTSIVMGYATPTDAGPSHSLHGQWWGGLWNILTCSDEREGGELCSMIGTSYSLHGPALCKLCEVSL